MLMGFLTRSPDTSPPSLCVCHLELKSQGFLCPCCSAKVCHVPCRSSHRRIYPLSSLSTAAYHASAVTLDAGLGPDRGDDTQSGAELDPERPLQNIMAEAERLSMFGNNTTSKSIHNVSF
jgi:hypothetical protein